MSSNFNKLIELIAEFSKIHKQLKNEPTFLEVSGYPHRENVYSNILAFFLDPQNGHGLSDLLLRSIMECIVPSEKLSNVEVEREVETGPGRIDLVIMSDTHIIAIENKIHHHTNNNPFSAYAKKIASMAEGRSIILILLGLTAIVDEKASEARFQPISYQQMFTKVQINLDKHVLDTNNKYLILFFEFMKTIENLTRGYQMDRELIRFFGEKQPDIEMLIQNFEELRKEFRSKLDQLRGVLREDFAIREQDGKVKQYFYRQKNKLWDSLVYEMTIEKNFTVKADCTIQPDGWEIEIYDKDETSIHKSIVEKMLQEKKIDYLQGSSKGKLKFKHSALHFDASIDDVAKKYGEDLLKKILA